MTRLGYTPDQIEDIMEDQKKADKFFNEMKRNRHWVLDSFSDKGIMRNFDRAKEFLVRSRVLTGPVGSSEGIEIYADVRKATGLYTGLWPGSLGFVHWAASKGSKFWKDKRVLEVGSGVGLAGLALAKLGARVTLTDIRELVPLLRENVDLNRNELGKLSPEVFELHWGEEGTYEQPMAETYDMVIGTDVTYSDELITPFLHVLSTLVFYSRIARNPMGLTVYLAASKSSQQGVEEFLQHAGLIFQYELVEQVKSAEFSPRFPDKLKESETDAPDRVGDVAIYALQPRKVGI